VVVRHGFSQTRRRLSAVQQIGVLVEDRAVTLPRRRRSLPVLPASVALIALVLLVPPLATILVASLRPGRALPFDATPLTLENYTTLLTDPFTYQLLANTLVYASSSLALGFAIALPVVWLVERTDLPFKALVSTAMFLPLIKPAALSAFGWVLLLSPRTGLINVSLRDLLGLQGVGPIDVYSVGGMVFLTGVGVAPSMFVMLSAAFRNMDARLEEVGRVSGASTPTIVRHITLPLMVPSITAAGIYYTIILIETFEIPLIIGLNADFRVLSTYIYTLVYSEYQEPAYGQAAAFGGLAVVLGLMLSYVYARIAHSAARYAVITGRMAAPKVTRLGAWKYVGLAFVGVYVLVSILLPILALVWTSLFTSPKPFSIAAIGQASLQVYGLVFMDPRWGKAIGNTFVLLLTAGVGTVLLATLVSWVVIRTKGGSLGWLDTLAFLPRAIPGVVLALAVFLLYIGTPLYGTIWILVIGHVVNYLPFAARVMHSAVLQIHIELEEAARTSGVGSLGTLIWVVLPLLRPAALNGLLWVVAHSVRDFTFPLMLGTGGNLVLSQLLWQSWSRGLIDRTAAMAVLLMVFLLLVVLPIRYRLARSEAA
jgi:iron(III) transport system permease protein